MCVHLVSYVELLKILLFAFYFMFFDDMPTTYEQKSRGKREQELTPYKRNVSV